MKIIIAGGSGFLGKALEKYFLDKKYEVKILTRTPSKINEIKWDAKSLGDWTKELENSDVLINLTGKSVDCRYTDKNKAEILSSRILSTQVLQKAIDSCKNPPKLWLNSSSATIYIHAETERMTEEKGIIGDDFSMNVCKNWESAFFEDSNEKVRKVALRTAIVLGNDGGAFPKLKMVTKLGLGGMQGRGNQKVSWIHIEDFCRAVEFVIKTPQINGVINLSSPNPVDNKHFMEILRNVFKIPFGVSSPTFLLEFVSILLQTETELLLKSRNVYPEKLLMNGFKFRYEDLTRCLSAIH
jgi:hypothetical protein